MSNPYSSLPKEKFWRSAVTDRTENDPFTGIWQPKSEISPDTTIITAGSCFAQHVGRWLDENGFDFRCSARAPEYNFSFATGNIYTPALLRQWLEAATGALSLDHVMACEGGRYFDLLRPNIHKGGFASAQELLDDRQACLDEIRANLFEADLFVFTLGLTEAWHHTDGTVYPMCPGTVAGTFEPAHHRFKNYDYTETLTEMKKAIAIAEKVNPGIRFLLTVSPVPLTATAGNNHVLPATIYSKSVLRACAEDLYQTHENIDYFPSFELISSHPIGGRFYEDNLRNVKKEGVAFVMSHLASAIGTATGEHKAAATPNNHTAKAQTEDEICEELMLEGWNKGSDSAVPDARFCLVGDSHMALISKSMTRAEVPHIGTITMKGADWAAGDFHPDEGDFFIPLNSRPSREGWLKTLNQLDALAARGEKPVILTNIGMHTRANVNLFLNWLQENGMMANIDIAKCFNFFREKLANHIAVLSHFINKGYDVLVFSDPPLQRFYEVGADIEPFVELYERLYGQLVEALGARFINVREVLTSRSDFGEHYCSPQRLENGERDWMHGSDTYYDALVAELKAA
ncbi:GSCFA domain-containing protein [Kordiimonas sp.]|uniref:GSCFA domain-containing protein n=1 Tax=Kordiimonas sp. TaxID=1970157 RepID=UPI003A9098AD